MQAGGLHVSTVWQSILLDPASLPFAPHDLPDIFTTFRQLVERAGVVPPAPLPRPAQIPALPPQLARLAET